MIADIRYISDKVRELRAQATERDKAQSDIFLVRNGHIEDVFPTMFSEDFPKPVIANFIDVCARTVAESLAPLPAFNCSATNMVSDAARQRADKRTKGISNYLDNCNFQGQMYTGADYFVSYGLLPVLVEPDFSNRLPRLLIMDPRWTYPEIDRYGKVISFTKVFRKRISELCAEYPDYAGQIAGKNQATYSQNILEVVLYWDDRQMLMFVPERADMVLAQARHPLGECPVVIAQRPGLQKGRGQFDDVLWTQVARNRFSLMAMAAAEASTEAPLAVPFDVQEMALGPYAMMRSASPEKIRRVDLPMPQAAFAEGQMLDQELLRGARFPETRTGNLDASIITGQGVHALEGGYDSQIRGYQDVLVDTFSEAVRMCLKMDELYWPDDERSIRGNQDGVPYEIKWMPSRDINSDHSVDVSFGFSVGLDPNRSLVFILQMLGARLISKDLARRQFPFGINVTQEEQRIEIEDLRDSLVQSLAGYAQAVPAMAQSGIDPSEAVAKIAFIIKGRQKGRALEDLVGQAFAPPPPPPAAEMPPGSEMMPPGAGPAGGALPPGVAPGQAQMGPGGAPDLMTMLAGLNSGGGPTTNVNVKRAIPAG